MKILAVDDDLFILELLSKISARVGFEDVSTAASGEIALELLRGGDVVFDCFLFDINMPEMDGIELCHHVRQISAYRKTPIIMLTAMTEKTYVDDAFRAGATDFVTKPFDISELGARLRTAQELVVARQEAAAALESAGQQRLATGSVHSFNLSDELQIGADNDLISYTALCNYLAQLSRSGLAGSQVLAVKIDRIEAIYIKATSDEFHYVLTEVADAIGLVFRPLGYIMAYAGNGLFLLVSSKAHLEPSIRLEMAVQNILDEMGAEYDDGDPLDLEVSIGNPIRPNTGKLQRIRKTFDRAIARAENRTLKKQGAPGAVNIRATRR
ncbi:Response regulator receiver domain-containing protein [Roseovarius azorensis]|uniref:Response regulator receiver domain-containing protein n=1 Tax=Roseovarius azorensis TaxID=1287727 RepID=A0A1H7V252_9RHOB|nr:response regulator [Roseovarius azorensis]SEM03224.1 Response regulator receiver domain-containing protein [Roseovarius azorensis]